MGQSTSTSGTVHNTFEGTLFSRVPSVTRNIVIFGESGAGKSSLISMLSGSSCNISLAQAINHAGRGAFTTFSYRIALDDMQYTLWETTGINESDLSSDSETEAVLNHLPEFLRELKSGISLLVHCIRASRYQESHKMNYDLFRQIISQGEIPTVIVITGLENEQGGMNNWWAVNKKVFEKKGMRYAGFACVTTLRGRDGVFEDLYEESRKAVRELIRRHCPRNSTWTVAPDLWLKRVTAEIQYRYKPQSRDPVLPSTEVEGQQPVDIQRYVEATLRTVAIPDGDRIEYDIPQDNYPSMVSTLPEPTGRSESLERENPLATLSKSINNTSSGETGRQTPRTPPISQSPILSSFLDTITTILNNTSSYKYLLEARGQKSEIILGILQKVLDYQDISDKLRRSLIIAMIRLSKASGFYPRCLMLHGIKHGAHPIASGAFGDIFRGTCGNVPVCMKVSRVYATSAIQRLTANFAREAIVWSQLSHPNVLPFYGIYHVDDTTGRLGLISPWMDNGNVCDYLERAPETPRLPLVFDTLKGLSYLHRNSIIHSDLKGANILVTPTGSASLADFGLSSVDDPDVLRWHSLSTTTQSGGTIRWQAPELLVGVEDGGLPRPSFQSDVYSIASVMYEILTGQLPFHEVLREPTVIVKILMGYKPTRPFPPLSETLELTDDIWAIMLHCWSPEPGNRLTVDELIQALRRLLPSQVTLKRVAMQYCSHPQGTVVEHHELVSAWAFRAARRGREDCLSGAEVQVLNELTV